jgi:lambda repressor-like predicted transcriptional regulator
MTAREIKAALILKGVTQTAIAKEAGISQTLVNLTIQGVERNRKARNGISKALGIPIHEIWPDNKLKKVVGG